MTPVYLDDGNVLRCPCCSNGYLHQGKIEAFSREREDAPSCGLTIDPGEIPRLGATGRNPSARRQGLLVHFECEFCGPLPLALGIAQSEGNTVIEWVKP